MTNKNILEQLEKVTSGGQEMDQLLYGSAVENLEPDVRLGVMACAVPERFDASLAQTLFSGPVGLNGNSGMAFEKVSSLPFVHHRPSGDLEFSPDARNFFVRELKNSYNGTLKEINEALVEYYGEETKDPSHQEKENLPFQFLKAFHTANVDRKKGFDELDRFENKLPNQEAKEQASYSIFQLCKKWDPVYDYHKENYYYYEGMRLYHQGKKKEALNFLGPVADSDLINKRVAIACHLVGRILSKDYKEKVKGYFQKSLNVGREIDDKSVLTQVLHSLGNLLTKDKNRHGEAEIHYNDSLKIGREIDDKSGQAQVLHSMGNLLAKDKNRHGEAEIHYNDSLALRETEDKSGQAQVLHSKGNLLAKDKNRHGEAEKHYNDSLKIGREIGDKSGQAQVLHSMGTLLGQIPKRFEDAERAFQESFEIYPNPNYRKQILTSWAAFYRERKLYRKAEEKIMECLETIKQLSYKDLVAKAMCYNELGHIHKALGRFEEAIDHYEKALMIEKNNKYKSGIERFIRDARKEQEIVQAERAKILEHGGPVDKNLSLRQRLQVMRGILKGSNAMDELMKERKRERERDE